MLFAANGPSNDVSAIDLESGKHALWIRADGYYGMQQDFYVEAGQSVTVRPDLVELPPQTVVSDLPHFTFLGRGEGELPGLALRRVLQEAGDETYEYWVPDCG